MGMGVVVVSGDRGDANASTSKGKQRIVVLSYPLLPFGILLASTMSRDEQYICERIRVGMSGDNKKMNVLTVNVIDECARCIIAGSRASWRAREQR